MSFLFAMCAVLGGTVLVWQLVMTFVGLGASDTGGDFSGDMGHDMGGDVHAGADWHGDGGSEVHAGASAEAHAGSDYHDLSGDAAHADSTAFFQVLSLRTVAAALTFFGLAGLGARSAHLSTPMTLFIAAAAGLGALYGVYWVMRGLLSLKAEGTVRTYRALGQPGTVYLRIPGQKSGAGKIQINVQNRTVELSAVTEGEALPTGANVVVVDVIDSNTVVVQPAPPSERN